MIVPVAQAAWLTSGVSTLRATDASAPRWKTVFAPRTALAAAAGSVIEPSTTSIFEPRWARFSLQARTEVVEDADGGALANEAIDEVRADKAGAAGNQAKIAHESKPECASDWEIEGISPGHVNRTLVHHPCPPRPMSGNACPHRRSTDRPWPRRCEPRSAQPSPGTSRPAAGGRAWPPSWSATTRPARSTSATSARRARTPAWRAGCTACRPTRRQAQLLDLIAQLNGDPAVSGILVQLPLPKQIDEAAVIRAVTPLKDVDCFHPENVGLLAAGHPRFLPCTPHGVQQLLTRTGIPTAGEARRRRRPQQHRRQAAGADPDAEAVDGVPGGGRRDGHGRAPRHARIWPRSRVRRTSSSPPSGVPRFVTGGHGQARARWWSTSGMNSVDGKLVGDVDEASVVPVAGWLSPVPGGSGR